MADSVVALPAPGRVHWWSGASAARLRLGALVATAKAAARRISVTCRRTNATALVVATASAASAGVRPLRNLRRQVEIGRIGGDGEGSCASHVGGQKRARTSRGL
jgi:hypothetical protein